jgi:Spy/CpxP family protein refolding chaperone
MKKNKTRLMTVLALGGLLAVTSMAFAQNANAGNGGQRRGGSVQQRVDRMATELNLTDDQKTKVTTLFESQAKKRQELQNLAPEDRREKARAMMQETNKKLKEILTPEQIKKWQEIRSQGRQRQGGAAPDSQTEKKQ